jgi:putative thioredoxin
MDFLSPNEPAQSANADAGPIKDSSDQDFMADVIEPSKEVPVLVDFWAPWCGPCRTLGPIIERAVQKAAGAVKLVKINIDENPGIAGQLRIQSIPAVLAFKDGQPVDGFMGALPEGQITDFINRISGQVGEAEIEELLTRADQALASGDLGGAAQDYSTVLQMDEGRVDALAGMARIYVAQGDAAQALAFLDMVPAEQANHPGVSAVRASIELAGEAQGAPELETAQNAAASDAQNPEVQFDLARAYLASGDIQAAIESLLNSIELDRDWNEAAARQLLLRTFDAAGAADPLVKAGRRRLSSILFA